MRGDSRFTQNTGPTVVPPLLKIYEDRQRSFLTLVSGKSCPAFCPTTVRRFPHRGIWSRVSKGANFNTSAIFDLLEGAKI